MRRPKILSIVLIAILLTTSFALSCDSGPTTDKPMVLREAMVHPATDPMGIETQAAAERFNARTDGKYILEVHPGGSLVGMPESLDAVRTGTVEIGQFPIGVFANLDAKFASAELPFLYNNIEANIAALQLLKEDYSKVLEENYNQKALGIWTATSLDLLSTKPVKTMEDWKGLLVQSINPPTAVTIETFGGSAVSIDWPEAYTSLDKGVVDATMVATMQMVLYNLFEVADYCVPIYMVPTAIISTINLDTWKELPKDIQEMLVEEHDTLGANLDALYKSEAPKNLGILEENGVEVIFITDAERAKWRAALDGYINEQIAAMGDFGKRILEVADMVNAQYPYQTYIK